MSELKKSFSTDEITVARLVKGMTPGRVKELYKTRGDNMLMEDTGHRYHDPLSHKKPSSGMSAERAEAAKQEKDKRGRPEGKTRKITYHLPGKEQKPFVGKPTRQQIDSGAVLEMEHPSLEEEKEIENKMKSEKLELFKSV